MVRLSLGHMFTVTESNISWPREIYLHK